MAEAMREGEEFRDDRRRNRPLPPEVVRELTRLDPWRSSLAMLQTLAATVVAVGVAGTLWTPWVVFPAIVVIGGLQHALFVLVHDSAHYRLFENRRLNDFSGRALAIPAGISMYSYRVIHRLHHNHLYTKLDPDMPLQGGYPRGRAYLLRKLAKDLAGLTALKTYAYFFGNPAINDEVGQAKRPLDDTAPELRRAARQDRWLVVAFHLGAPVAAFSAGVGWQYLVLWVVPLLTVIQAILRLRAVCEHGAVTDAESPLTAARTNLVPGWLRWWLFPHHVHYHIEHHLYPSIPHYRLPQAHAELQQRGWLEHAEVRALPDTLRIVVAEPQT